MLKLLYLDRRSSQIIPAAASGSDPSKSAAILLVRVDIMQILRKTKDKIYLRSPIYAILEALS